MSNPLVRNIIRTFSTQVGCQLIAILSGIVVARAIGPSSKGFASYATTAVALVTVFFYGFADAVLYQFGKLQYSARAVHNASVRIIIVALVVIVPIFVAVAIAFPSQRALAAAAAALPFAIYMQVTTPFLMVRGNMAFVNARALIQSFGTASLTVGLLLFAHLGLGAVVGAWVLFYAVGAIQSVYAIRSILNTPGTAETVPTIVGDQAKFGFRAAGVALSGFLNSRIDVFVVSVMLPSAALGWYTIAIASGEMLWQVSRAFVWSALGRIGSDPMPIAAALVARLTRNVLAIVGSLGVVAFFAGPWLITHVYGSAYSPAGSALQWALPGLVAYAAEVALTQFMVLQAGRPLRMVWLQLSAALVCAAITVATAGHYGIVAAAAATSLTKLLVTVVLITMFARTTGIAPRRLLFIQREDLLHYAGVLDSALRTLRLRSA